jgi:hypothetical protein
MRKLKDLLLLPFLKPFLPSVHIEFGAIVVIVAPIGVGTLHQIRLQLHLQLDVNFEPPMPEVAIRTSKDAPHAVYRECLCKSGAKAVLQSQV